ncbi:hypothetical protein AGDE_00803 [Angomonas deanei]|uniref:Protein-serine/threonine kinase n=1 Tax=Angomonas deanei TaxID=59799 RepID=S9UQV0_9TRYP|nr:hypothetical protein AGDE_09201 [Angomonas deanei]EPY43120.1 hypothetical protein AGDE_00803 [Angomonas deanei]CAD2214808.1 Histidine kinase-, DNA gyrase B-, and HSP90-like ATPase, putative [Angomonas deanei]|eukprot:EPY31144.1 hypothetical protein AGDE_09201 [Angomonas deanei]
MPLHKYDSLIRKIDKSGTPSLIQKFLSLERTPFRLAAPHVSHEERVRFFTEQLAIRTAYAYSAFSDPIIKERLSWPTSTGLRWLQRVSQREFVYCVGLQRAAENGLSTDSSDLSLSSSSCATKSRYSYLLNTDDNSLVFDSISDGPQESDWRRPMKSQITNHEEAERMLLKGDVNLEELPLDIALEILRPKQSLLDILVNETSINSVEENAWFSCFFRNHVSWRVMQEHLLHCIRPDVYPVVVCEDTDIPELIKAAGDEVADIFSNMQGEDHQGSLTINIDEDDTILGKEPEGHLFRSCDQPPITPISDRHPRTSRIYSVVGHYSYIFREILKNACVASLKTNTDTEINVKYTVDDEWVVVDVEDTAGGVPLKHGEKIWRFGWTTSEHFESHLCGFGVGLSTSKVYSDMWGGSIDVYSRVGKGTTVRVRLPKSPVEMLA